MYGDVYIAIVYVHLISCIGMGVDCGAMIVSKVCKRASLGYLPIVGIARSRKVRKKGRHVYGAPSGWGQLTLVNCFMRCSSARRQMSSAPSFSATT